MEAAIRKKYVKRSGGKGGGKQWKNGWETLLQNTYSKCIKEVESNGGDIQKWKVVKFLFKRHAQSKSSES
jgi:hypothetical protein